MSGADAGGVSNGDGGRGRWELCVWLAHLASFRAGLVGKAVRSFGSFGDVLEQPPARIAALTTPRTSAAPSKQDADACARYAALGPASTAGEALRSVPAGARARLLARVEPDYPARLEMLADAPAALFACVGAAVPAARLDDRLRALASAPVVAVVGARSPSPYGREMAAGLAADLVGAGVVVVSGLAYGIDAVAHQAALDASSPDRLATVAVLGCGCDVVYPRAHARLHAAIAARGLLVSEFCWGVTARPWRFPARNRVIAGLADAVVVVEGSERSGALITARFALDLGREVLAVPGEAGRRLSAGPHDLIRTGAGLCESAADVLVALGWHTPPGHRRGSAFDGRSGLQLRLLEALDAAPATIDELAVAAGATARDTAIELTTLEMDGLVEAQSGGQYRLRRREARGAAPPSAR